MIDLAAPGTNIILLTSGGMALIIPLMIIMINDELGSSEKSVNRTVKLAEILSVCLSACLIWTFSLIDNTDALLKERAEKAIDQLANRICSQIESNEAYLSGCEVAIVGIPSWNNNYDYVVTDNVQKGNNYAIWGLFWGSYSGAYNCWKQLYLQHFGIELRWCTEDRYCKIGKSSQFEKMPCYPQQGSISIIENVLVVKISDMSTVAD